jgi:hypothetical protein
VSLLGRWIAATVVAEAVGFAAAMALGRGVYALADGGPAGAAGALFEAGLAATAGAVEGACLGAGTWRVLRGLRLELRARAWVGATALGGALAWVIGMTAGSHGPATMPAPAVVAAALVGSGLVLGAVLGGTQAWALRRTPWLARRWVVASSVGWMSGLLAVYAALALVPGEGVSPALVAAGVLGGAAMAVAPALATGLLLRRFAR